MRYLIKFSYDGTNFYGYQTQPNLRTIQNELENAVEIVNNNIRKTVQSSGRTDKGVHALCQYAHVDLDIEITPKKLKRALNSNLPDDIHVIDARIVGDKFHARYSTKEKEYKYYINLGEYNPVERNYVFQYNYKLDVDAIKDAIKVFIGEHDFRAFVTENKDKLNCIRTINIATVEKLDEKLIFTFRGDGFLRYQVRNMVGILIRIGENKLNSSDLLKILNSKDRSKCGVTAPSEGLYLTDVVYKDLN